MVAIDWRLASDVGAWYLSTPNAPRDPWIVAAYEQLQRENDRLYERIVGQQHADAVRVVFTRCREPYADADELIEAVQVDRILEVTSAAVTAGRIHPLLECEFGGAFDRFRAVHDLLGHGGPGLGFDLEGEFAAWQVQDRLHSGIARLALVTELCGVNSARWVAGEAPEERAVLLDPHVLAHLTSAASRGPTPMMRPPQAICEMHTTVHDLAHC